MPKVSPDDATEGFRFVDASNHKRDNPGVRALTARILQSRGYTPIAAINGDHAITVFAEHKDKVDLIIVDVVMSKKNGREAYGGNQKISPAVRVIFTSGHPRDICLMRASKRKESSSSQNPSPLRLCCRK
jgi:CheY-like chemotaxis protein